MPQLVRKRKPTKKSARETRFTVGLAPKLANQVEHYADTVDVSMSKAIAALVRLGLENQGARKREFFKKLKDNLAEDTAESQDRMVEEFKAMILGF